MSGPDPAEFGWWLASRAAGVVALVCITLSVAIGLAMAGRVSRRPALAATMLSVHQHAALAGLVATAVHGITLLGDRFLSPSLGDIALPFTSEHEPLWTGLGVTGGWLAAILGLTFWIRDRLPAGLWRKLHRVTVLVYALSVAHTLGAGTDAAQPWMRALLMGSGAPILFLFIARVLTPAPPAPAGLRRFRVAGVQPESNSVLSFDLVPVDRGRVPAYEPGQFVTVHVTLPGGERQTRSYSLSSAPRPAAYRISVKREVGGRVSEYLHTAVEVGDVLELGSPAGRFAAGTTSERPLVLISAGIGVTPLLAMLEATARSQPDRAVWWIHSARNGAEHAFRSEALAYLGWCRRAHTHIRYTQPQPRDQLGRDFDAVGRLTGEEVLSLGVPAGAEFRLCGPPAFVSAITAGLVAGGVRGESVASESFGGPRTAPRRPDRDAADVAATAVEFSRSGVVAAWGSEFSNLLEVAEASAVPVASGCRIGACHGCRASVVTGSVRHDPEPVEPPPPGSALLCCAVPQGDVVLDA